MYDSDFLGAVAKQGELAMAMRGESMMPRGRWACLELEVHGPAAGSDEGRLRLKLDNQTVHDLPIGAPVLPPEGFRTFLFGLIGRDLREDTEAWVDDVVLSRSPVGCD